jgi:hypothetical protein
VLGVLGRGRQLSLGQPLAFNQGWNIVYIPATTGDAYLGDKVRRLTTSTGTTYSAHFVGYRNVQLDLGQIRAVPEPQQGCLMGQQWGRYRPDVQPRVIPYHLANAPMWMMDSAGPAVGTRDLWPQFAAAASLDGAWKQTPGGGVIPRPAR